MATTTAGVATAAGAGAGASAGSGLLGQSPAHPLFTPVIFCQPSAALSLAPLASTSTTSATTDGAEDDEVQDPSSAAAAADQQQQQASLPAALLPVANRPLIAFVLQQLVSAGIRHAIVCAPASQHSLFAHTLRHLQLAPPSTAAAPTTPSPNVQVLIDPLPGTSRRATPSANTYILRVDLVPLGPGDRPDKTRFTTAGTAVLPPPAVPQQAKSRRKTRPLGSAQLLLWLASEGWLEADPLVLPYDLITPSLPLSALIRAHQIASSLLPSTTFPPGYAPPNGTAARPLLLGATTLLIEKRAPANTRSKAAQGDAVSKERAKAEKKALVAAELSSERLTVYSKHDFGALHGFSSSTVSAPHTGRFIAGALPTSSPSLISEAPHSAHALLYSTPLSQAKAASRSTAFVLPPGIGRRTGTSKTQGSQPPTTASAHVSTSLVDSGVYILPRATILPLLERFSSFSPTSTSEAAKIKTVPHLVSLLARASVDERYARKLGIDTLVRRLARSYAQTHAERAGLGPVVSGVITRSGTLDDGGGGGGGARRYHASPGGGVGGGMADSLVLGSAAGTGHATPGFLSSPPGAVSGTTATTSAARAARIDGNGQSATSAVTAAAGGGGEVSSSDPLLVGLGASMSRLSVSIAAAHSSASRSSLTGERSTTSYRTFATPSNGNDDGASAASAAETRVQAIVARLQTDTEAFVLGGAEDAAGASAQQSGKGKGGSNAGPVVETERFLEKVDTPAKYLEANKFLIRALAAPSTLPLFPIPSIAEAGVLGQAPPVEPSQGQGQQPPPPQPQITPDALIASSSSTTLGDRCVIRRSVVGKGCTIARGAKILGCVLMPGVSVGENAKLESVVLAPHTVVGARVTLVDVNAGPEGLRIADGTEAKVTNLGPAGAGANSRKTGGGKSGAGGMDELEEVEGLVDHVEDSDDDDDEDESEEGDEE